MLAAIREFPTYSLSVSEARVESTGGSGPVVIELSIQCGLTEDPSVAKRAVKKQKGRSICMTAVLTLTSDLELVDFRRIP
jgi:ATP-dependent DNA helicase HFM1/MER3